MSQVKFKTKYDGKNVEVVGGWDNPLQSHHLTIFDLDAPDDAETDVLWCQMDHVGFPKTLEPLQKQLFIMGIDPPEGFWECCSLHEGNVVFTYRDNEWHRNHI